MRTLITVLATALLLNLNAQEKPSSITDEQPNNNKSSKRTYTATLGGRFGINWGDTLDNLQNLTWMMKPMVVTKKEDGEYVTFIVGHIDVDRECFVTNFSFEVKVGDSFTVAGPWSPQTVETESPNQGTFTLTEIKKGARVTIVRID